MKTKSLFLLSSLILAFSGCASVQVSPEIREAKKAREQLFEENLPSYKSRTVEEAELVKKIVENYKHGYETFDLALISKILSPDFELRYYFQEDQVQIQSHGEYLDKRKVWKPRADPHRKLLVSIKASHYDEKKNRHTITMLTTYRSKYFNPRFLEVLVFEKKGGWVLRRVLMYPMHPPRPELYEVRIFFGEYLTGKRSIRGVDVEDGMVTEGPDVPFERYVRLSKVGPRSEAGGQGPLVIIFSEPPPDGAEIQTSEQQLEGFGGVPRTFTPYTGFVRVSRGGNPYYYLVGSGWWGYSYSVNVQVRLNGVKISDEILRIQ